MPSSVEPLLCRRSLRPFLARQAYCTETFGETKLAPVVGQGLSVPELQEGCERIMNLLRLNFYLLDYTVGSDLGRGLITVSGGWGGFRREWRFTCVCWRRFLRCLLSCASGAVHEACEVIGYRTLGAVPNAT